ncbi:MAG: hypothetical protein AAF735_05515 [Myxococcota bacterium]
MTGVDSTSSNAPHHRRSEPDSAALFRDATPDDPRMSGGALPIQRATLTGDGRFAFQNRSLRRSSDAFEITSGTPYDQLIAHTLKAGDGPAIAGKEDWLQRVHPAFRDGVDASRDQFITRRPEEIAAELDGVMKSNGPLIDRVARRESQMVTDFVKKAAQHGPGTQIVAFPTPCVNPLTQQHYWGAGYALILPAKTETKKLYVHKIGTHENEWDPGRIKQAAILRMSDAERGLDEKHTTQIFFSGPPTSLRLFQDAFNIGRGVFSDTNRNAEWSEDLLRSSAPHPMMAKAAAAFAGTRYALGNLTRFTWGRFYLDVAQAAANIAITLVGSGKVPTLGRIKKLLPDAVGFGQRKDPDFIKYSDTQFNSDTRIVQWLLAQFLPHVDASAFIDEHSGLPKDELKRNTLFIDNSTDSPTFKRDTSEALQAIGASGAGDTVAGDYGIALAGEGGAYEARGLLNSLLETFARPVDADYSPNNGHPKKNAGRHVQITTEEATADSGIGSLISAVHSADLQQYMKEELPARLARGEPLTEKELGAIHAYYQENFALKGDTVEHIRRAMRLEAEVYQPLVNGARASIR